MNYDYVFKILFIGESGVGKSTLAMQFAGRGFVEDMPTTIGACGGVLCVVRVCAVPARSPLTRTFTRRVHGVFQASTFSCTSLKLRGRISK